MDNALRSEKGVPIQSTWECQGVSQKRCHLIWNLKEREAVGRCGMWNNGPKDIQVPIPGACACYLIGQKSLTNVSRYLEVGERLPHIIWCTPICNHKYPWRRVTKADVTAAQVQVTMRKQDIYFPAGFEDRGRNCQSRNVKNAAPEAGKDNWILSRSSLREHGPDDIFCFALVEPRSASWPPGLWGNNVHYFKALVDDYKGQKSLT